MKIYLDDNKHLHTVGVVEENGVMMSAGEGGVQNSTYPVCIPLNILFAKEVDMKAKMLYLVHLASDIRFDAGFDIDLTQLFGISTFEEMTELGNQINKIID